MSRWCSPQFQGYQGKDLSFKTSTTKQNFLELPSVLQCQQSESAGKSSVSNQSNPRSTPSRENKILLFKRFEIPFLENSEKGKSPNSPVLNEKESKLVKDKLKEILLKGAIEPVSPCTNQYLSNFFLVSKRDEGNRPVINLKHLNNFIPYQHFKME